MLLDILEEHFDEAGFLYERWCTSTPSDGPTDDSGAIEHRLRAHLDGLLLAGEAAWSICERRLEAFSSANIFVAAVVAEENKTRLLVLERAMSSATDNWLVILERAHRVRLESSARG